MNATSYTQPTRNAENRTMTASTVTETLRRRMAGAAGTLLAVALLLGIPSSGWAQRALVIDKIDIEVCENDTVSCPNNDTDTQENTANYTVNLSTVPTGNVTVTLAVESDHPKPPTVIEELLTFTSDDWSSPQTVTVTGVDDLVDNPGGFRLATIKHTATGGGFSTSKTVHVAVGNDDDAAGIALVPDTVMTVTEGGTDGDVGPSDTYTVELSSEPTGTVTVSLKVGGKNPDAATVEPASLTFTPDDWGVQTVAVTGVPDDSAEERMATITHTPTGGSYENVSAPTRDVTIRNVGRTDQNERGVIYDPPSLVIDEGGTGAYTIRLTSSPGTSNVEVTLDIPESREVIEITSLGQGKLTFTADNWDVSQRIEVTVKDNPVSADHDASITHTFTNYFDPDEVMPEDTTLTVTARDKDKKELSVSSRALEFGENSFRRYSVKLTSKPTGPVVVTVGGALPTVAKVTYEDEEDEERALSQLTFTDVNWNKAQTVFVRGIDDAVRHPGGRRTTITHTANGADYERGVDTVSVKVTIIDVDDAPEIMVIRFPPEESSIPDDDAPLSLPSYKVGLSTYPSLDVKVKIDMESVKGSDGLVSGTDCGSPSKSIVLTFVAVPDADVTVVPDAQEVAICVGDDQDSPGSSRRVTITHTASGGEYSDVSAVRKKLTVTDDEDSKEGISAKLSINKERLSVREDGGKVDGYGTPVPYTVRLDSNDILVSNEERTVTLEDYSTDIKVTDSQTALETPAGITNTSVSLTFSSAVKVHTVYVIGVDDNVVGSRSTSIVHTVSGVDSYNPIEVPITVSDHGDTVELLITGDELPRPVINENGDTYTYDVRLRSSPPPLPGEEGEVVVHVISREPSSVDVTAPASKSLTFDSSNWSVVQTVTVTSIDDMIDNPGGSRSVVITHTPEGPGYGYNQRKDITVKVEDQDSDVAGIIVGDPLSAVYEGVEGTFTAQLSAPPQVGKTVAVRVTSDSIKATVRPSSLTFTHANWDLPQTVYVTGVSGSHEGVDTEVTLTPSGGNYGARAMKVRFEVLRSTAPGLRVAPQQLEVSEGGTETYTVELNTDPGQTVMVSILSGSVLTVSPKSLTFTGGDDGNWDTPQRVTITGREDTLIGDRSATITHAAADYPSDRAEVRVQVTDNDATVTVSPTSITVPEAGGRATYTMKLNGQPTDNVTLTVASSNTSAATVSPGSLAFTT